MPRFEIIDQFGNRQPVDPNELTGKFKLPPNPQAEGEKVKKHEEREVARRLKPPISAKEALRLLDEMDRPLGVVTSSRCSVIREALERLQELESDHVFDNMRRAADWQLEQVIEWLKSERGRSYYLNSFGYYDHEVDVEEVLEDLKEAMRPQQQKEKYKE